MASHPAITAGMSSLTTDPKKRTRPLRSEASARLRPDEGQLGVVHRRQSLEEVHHPLLANEAPYEQQLHGIASGCPCGDPEPPVLDSVTQVAKACAVATP